MTTRDQRERARQRYGRGDIRTGNAGHSSAAWIGVAVILAGCIVAAVAMPMDKPWLFWVGIGIAAVGAILGKLLSLMGMGVPPGYHQEGDVELRDRFVGEGGVTPDAEGAKDATGVHDATEWSAEHDTVRRHNP